MLAKFDDLFARRSGREAERRRVDRSNAAAGVQVRSMQGDTAAAVVHDVSPFGCSLAFTADWRRMGMIVRLTPSDGQRIDAVVRWLDETMCGIEFLRPVANAGAVFGAAE